MSHEIEMQNGVGQVFTVGTAPWHGLGTVLEKAPSVEEAIVAAGLNWEVRVQPLHMKFDGEELSIPSHNAMVRSTDKKVLGVVGHGYTPVQNKNAFAWFQPWIDAGEATLDTAGSLRGGKRVWMLAKTSVGTVEVVRNDPITSYILLSNGHDGSLALRCGFTNVRVVCANTMASAHGDQASKLLRIRHTSKATEALAQVQQAMNLARKEFETSVEGFRSLARKGVVTEDVQKYVRKVFAPKVTLKTANEVESDNERLLAKIIPLFEKGRGNDQPGVAGTAWAMYNAVNEYLGFERGNSDDRRLDSMWYGDSARLNQKALDVALKFANG